MKQKNIFSNFKTRFTFQIRLVKSCQGARKSTSQVYYKILDLGKQRIWFREGSQVHLCLAHVYQVTQAKSVLKLSLVLNIEQFLE